MSNTTIILIGLVSIAFNAVMSALHAVGWCVYSSTRIGRFIWRWDSTIAWGVAFLGYFGIYVSCAC